MSSPSILTPGTDVAAREALVAALLAEFQGFGAERIEPAIVQPAESFLDRMGEELRSQTCVFTGPDGSELCLRPDLTIPAAKAYLARVPDGSTPLKLCYAGPVFRSDPDAAGGMGQFFHAGVESFRAPDTASRDIEILTLTHKALQKAGLRASSTTIGDVSLFRALLAGLNLPASWTARIRRHAWHPERLRAHLQRLTDEAVPENGFLAMLTGQPPARARDLLREAMGLSGIRIVGTRSFDEITERMIAQANDAAAARLSPSGAAAIESFLGLRTSAKAAPAAIRRLADAAGIDIASALAAFAERLDLLASTGVDLARLEFAAQFGRNMEYYSGFVFELRAPSQAQPVAGGGRYDGLLSSLGAVRPTPAIGLAVFCDRLSDAIAQQGGRP